MKAPPNPHYRHRFPAEIISHAVWLYHVFSLGLRDVEVIVAERREGEQLGRLIAGAACQRSTNDRAGVRCTGAMWVTRPSMRQPLRTYVNCY